MQYFLVTDGADAVAEVRDRWLRSKTMYKLIVMDQNMPYMNGINATEHILNFTKEHRIEIPYICIFSSHITDELSKQA